MPKKPVKEVTKLDPIKVRAVEKAVKSGDIPVITVEGDCSTKYNAYKAISEDAEGQMAELKRVMLPDALGELYSHNTERPWQPISSVKLQDDNSNVTRVTFTSKYLAAAVAVVEAVFGSIKTKDGKKVDVNNYFTRTMVGEFDSAVFLGADGKFEQKRYDAIMEALDGVCERLKIQSRPLVTHEAVIPMPDFKARRWMDFDAATNQRITDAVPNQINFVPCPNAKSADRSDE
jgi:hypothetical protein